ncbi:hypothetical protein GWI33_016775 [Rhynchophorus ferrugineus]|uniref:Uncharacterized protein n=1 Tax=Rhynchophorus ferrugineus TaxID=354439 RepID=A0A834M8A8_RHYFE|nr:hypothetical protein GWI33_016775 [Rhynchophorus ferrugineus]
MRNIQIIQFFILTFGYLDCNVYKPIFFKEEEVRHIREASVEKPLCKEDLLLDILVTCQVTSPESIVGLAISDFDSACKMVPMQTRRMEKLFKNCSATGLYLNLMNGLKSFDEKLCKNNDFYFRYDLYDKCITDLDNDFDACDGVADWNEDTDPENVCKTYKKILDCYYIKTAKVCGLKAASTLKELMVEVIDCTIKEKCPVSMNPSIHNPMPEKYINIINKGVSIKENIRSAILLNICLLMLIGIL